MKPQSTDATAARDARAPPRSFLRFSTRTLLIALTLICVWLAWRTSQVRTQQRDIGRRLVEMVLLARHWEAWATDVDMRSRIKDLAAELTTASVQSKVIGMDGTLDDGAAADAFETELLSRWKSSPGAGEQFAEFAERNAALSGRYVYYHPVRSKASCFGCHRSDFAPDSLRSDWQPPSGALMGIVKIELVD